MHGDAFRDEVGALMRDWFKDDGPVSDEMRDLLLAMDRNSVDVIRMLVERAAKSAGKGKATQLANEARIMARGAQRSYANWAKDRKEAHKKYMREYMRDTYLPRKRAKAAAEPVPTQDNDE